MKNLKKDFNNVDVHVIIWKKYPKYVRIFKVGDLELNKCSNKFISHIGLNLSLESYVFVKCLKNGDIDYRKKSENKIEYILYRFSENFN